MTNSADIIQEWLDLEDRQDPHVSINGKEYVIPEFAEWVMKELITSRDSRQSVVLSETIIKLAEILSNEIFQAERYNATPDMDRIKKAMRNLTLEINSTTHKRDKEENGTIIEFLCGEKPFDGVWFSEKHPTEKGAFWWRKHLRNHEASLDSRQLKRERVKIKRRIL